MRKLARGTAGCALLLSLSLLAACSSATAPLAPRMLSDRLLTPAAAAGSTFSTQSLHRRQGRETERHSPFQVTGLLPTHGLPGILVKIEGEDFPEEAGRLQVSFNQVPARIVSSTEQEVVVVVPDQATTGPVTVTLLGETAETHHRRSRDHGDEDRRGDEDRHNDEDRGGDPQPSPVPIASDSSQQFTVDASIPVTLATGSSAFTSNPAFGTAQDLFSGLKPWNAGCYATSSTVPGACASGVVPPGTSFDAPSVVANLGTVYQNISVDLVPDASPSNYAFWRLDLSLDNQNWQIGAAYGSGYILQSISQQLPPWQLASYVRVWTYDWVGSWVQFKSAKIRGVDALLSRTVAGVPSPQLTVTGLNTAAATTGTGILISGSGFSTTPGANAVTFNGVPATVLRSATNWLLTAVPAAATTGPLIVTVGNQTASYGTFQVLGPSAQPIAPVDGWSVPYYVGPSPSYNVGPKEFFAHQGNFVAQGTTCNTGRSDAMCPAPWIAADLGKAYTLSKVLVMPLANPDAPMSWTVQVSQDKTTWTTVGTGSGNSFSRVETTFPPVAARYARIVGNDWGQSWFSLLTVQFWGT